MMQVQTCFLIIICFVHFHAAQLVFIFVEYYAHIFTLLWTWCQGILKGEYHCTIDLLFDWFGLVCFENKKKNCRLLYSWFQSSQTGSQWYSDTSPFSIPWWCIATHFHSVVVKILQMNLSKSVLNNNIFVEQSPLCQSVRYPMKVLKLIEKKEKRVDTNLTFFWSSVRTESGFMPALK